MRVLTELELNRDKSKKREGESDLDHVVRFIERVGAFVAAVQEKTTAHTAKNFSSLTPDTISAPEPWGSKYIRIVRAGTGQRSVHCFIDRSNGDILKAAGWVGPAKHARGNIFADDIGLSCMDPYGPKYLR